MGAFSVFKKKKSNNTKQQTPTVEAHYMKLARRASLLRYTVLVLIVLFAVYSFSFHSSEITVDNFEYMMKFLNVGEDTEARENTVIAFDGSKGNRGIIYKGDLAVLNENGLTVTGWDGDVILRETFSFDHPKMIENGINVFCYDLGGRELRIFNSYSQLQRTSYDYPIRWLSAAASGEYAIVSSAKGYRSAVYVYDKEFRLIFSRLFGDKYVDFVAVSPNGQEFITAAHYSKNGNLITQLSKFSTTSADALFTQEFIGEIPLGIYYTSEGCCLLTTDKMRYLNNDNEIVSETAFGERKLLSGKVFGNRTLVNYALEGLSGGTETVVYRADGSIEFQKRFATSLSDTLICENTLYTLSPGTLTVFDMESGEEHSYSIPTSYSSLVPDGNELILFSENQAEFFDPSAYEGKE